MQVVCQATVPGHDEEVKKAALQCLVRIMSLFYKYMHFYMAEALFPVRGTPMAAARQWPQRAGW